MSRGQKFVKGLETIAIIILIISFGVLAYCVYISFKMDKEYAKNQNTYEADKLIANVEKEESTDGVSEIIEKVTNSVVGISKLKNKGSTVFLSEGTTELGLGSGFIVSQDGYIVTNQHVSGSKYNTCYVTLADGRSFDGTVVWADEDIDLSVVKINSSNLDYLQLGNSDSIKVAQNVYAIGNPIGFEFQRTVTYGIISGLDRTIKLEEEDKTYYMEDLIQTDATINPGNSGGPLINNNGQVIGINSVKITSAEGIGFAIPINIIKPIIESFIQTGGFDQATLGIFAYDKNVIPYINSELGTNKSLDSGIYVAKVNVNSPASKNGIKEGDIILEIDDTSLEKMSKLREYIYSKKPGDTVALTYMRNNREYDVQITLVKK